MDVDEEEIKMEFKTGQDELKKALSKIQSIVEKKTTKPILTNTLIQCRNNQLILSATDLEVGIRIELVSETSEEGELAVPAKNLYDIVREIPGKEITFRQKDGQWLEILSGRSKFKITGLPSQEFPNMPDTPQKNFFSVDAPSLKNMIHKTLYAVSNDEAKYNLNGLYLEPREGNVLRMTATDGHRLSYCEREMTQKVFLEQAVLLPKKGVLELQKLIQEDDGVLPLLIDGRSVIAKQGEVTLFLRLMEGKFPNYQAILPKDFVHQASISRLEFVGALRRVSLLSQEQNRGVKMTFSTGYLELKCSNPDLGEAKEEIECDYKGNHLEIGFNYRYFLDVTSVLEDDVLTLEFRDEISPCVLRSGTDRGFLSLVMPMRL